MANHELKYLSEFRRKLIEESGAAPESISGLPSSTIEKWEEAAGQQLPAAYREFLLFCGAGTDGRINDRGLITERRTGNELIRREVSRIFADRFAREIPKEIWALEEWLGEYFSFFRLGEGENPPVYEWSEDDEEEFEPELRAESFSEYLEQRLKEWIRYNSGS